MLSIWTIDSFTSIPYSGNPAAVCLMGTQELEETQMLQIAAEMKHSETAFVSQLPASSDAHFNLRWFTPTVEVTLCGHATLATAHVLFNEVKITNGQEINFLTKSGILKVTKMSDGRLEMDFPKGRPVLTDIGATATNDMCNAFHIAQSSICSTHFCAQTKKLIVGLHSPSDILAAVVPQSAALTSIPWPMEVRGIALCSSRADSGWDATPDPLKSDLKNCDIVSRYFSPWNGIPEDPVNGSSHTVIPYIYSARLEQAKMVSYAASVRRGHLTVEIKEDHPERIFISGNACTVLSGQIKIEGTLTASCLKCEPVQYASAK